MNLPAASGRVLKDVVSVTASHVVTRQSHGKRSLRFARALEDDHLILGKCPWGAMTFPVMIRTSLSTRSACATGAKKKCKYYQNVTCPLPFREGSKKHMQVSRVISVSTVPIRKLTGAKVKVTLFCPRGRATPLKL